MFAGSDFCGELSPWDLSMVENTENMFGENYYPKEEY